MSETGWAPRVAAGAAIVGGLALIGAIIAGSTFSRADDGQRATDLVRAEMTRAGLARHRADYELARAGVDQFYDEALPVFAQQLGTTPQGIATRYPAVGKLEDPSVRAQSFTFADAIVTNLEHHRGDFEDADAIPVGWLPMTAGPWIGLAAGAALVLVGVWALLKPAALPFVVLGVLALGLVVGPLVTRFPQKAHAAHRLLGTLKVTPAVAAHTRDILETAGAALDESEQRLYPDVAAARHVTRQQLDASIAEQFPAVAQLRAQERAVYARYERRVEIREGGLKVIPGAKKFPLERAIWWPLVIGGVVLLTSIVGLVACLRKPNARLTKA